jgi:hypothetical protein
MCYFETTTDTGGSIDSSGQMLAEDGQIAHSFGS